MSKPAVLHSASGTTSDEMMVTRDAREEASGLTFDSAFERFMKLAQAKMDAMYAISNERGNKRNEEEGRSFQIFQGSQFSAEPGKRYIRVITRHTMNGVAETHGRSAYCFIDRMTGDVLKPASWKGPTKHARGNVFDTDPVASVGQHGIAYIR